MPLSVWDGPLRVVVSQSFGKQGNRQGTPVTYHWRWYHHVPGLALWAIVFLLLAGRKANRSFPAWAILIPLGLVSTAWRVPLAIVGMSPGDWESLGIFFLTIAIGLSIVWLLGDWLARRPIRWRMASALGVMLVVIAVSYPLHFESGWRDEPSYLISSIGSAVLVIGAFALTGVSCRGFYSAARLLLWLVLWTTLLVMSVPLIFAIIPMLLDARAGDQSSMLLGFLLMGLMMAGMVNAVLLPFAILSVNCPLYRDRLQGALGLGDVQANKSATSPFADDTPLSTEPTRQPVSINDVAGR